MAGSVSFSCALLSVVSCSVVIFSISRYLQKKTSYHLQLVSRLLICDVGISLCIIMYFITEHATGGAHMRAFCNVFLPLILFCFLASFGWTIMLAMRFRTSHDINGAVAAAPAWVFRLVWAVPLLLCLAAVIVIWSAGHVTAEQGDDDDHSTDNSCTFDHEHWNGILLDLAVFQMPILLTIAINLYIYSCGLRSLGNAPHSVIARQMRKAGGYLAVLVVVWVPNLVYNLLSIADGSDRAYGSLLDMSVLLFSLQGFLNVCVYVYSNEKMRRWLLRYMRGGYRNRDTWHRRRRPQPHNTQPAVASGGAGGAGGRDEAAYSDEDEDVAPWLRDAESFSGHMPEDLSFASGGAGKTIAEVRATETSNSLTSNSNSNSLSDRPSGHNTPSVVNPLSLAIPPPAPSTPNSGKKTKSILITPSMGTRTSSQQSSVAHSQELDQERFVRFGETSTRIISVAPSTPRGSEFMMNEEGEDEDDEDDRL